MKLFVVGSLDRDDFTGEESILLILRTKIYSLCPIVEKNLPMCSSEINSGNETNSLVDDLIR